MNTGTRIKCTAVFLVIATCLIGTAAATSLGIDWKQSPMLTENVYSGITLTPDASTVFSGGSQLIVRSWDGNSYWGGQSGFISAMSSDGNYVVTSTGSTITLLNKSGQQLWSRNMDGTIKAVAIAPDGKFVISADDKGNYNSWAPNGDFIARNKTDVVKRIAIAPKGNLIVVTTDAGIRYFTSSLDPVWTDPRAGSLDDYIVISADGSTVITAGGPRLSSHTPTGTLNWQTEVTDTVINDVACSQDCSLIIVGSQDNTVEGLDRYGKTHWTYKAGQWPNAVGTSSNGAVVAAGINDGTVIILDHNGKQLTEKKFDSRVQPRTLAVSRDGTKVAFADQYYLYGLSLYGITGSESADDTIFVAAPLNPVQKTTVATATPTEPPVYVTMPEEARPTATATTKASPAGMWIVLPAVAGAFWLAGRCHRQ